MGLPNVSEVNTSNAALSEKKNQHLGHKPVDLWLLPSQEMFGQLLQDPGVRKNLDLLLWTEWVTNAKKKLLHSVKVRTQTCCIRQSLQP